MADITLTASMRSNLLSLKNTTELMSTTQNRLSTGLKVNSAIDNPSSYYTAQSLNNRASDLSSLLDSMTQGIQTVKAANEGIESITALVEQAKSIANSARDTTDLEEREKYATRLNEVLDQIDGVAKDSGYKGINLIYGAGNTAEGDSLKVRFNEYMGAEGTSITVTGVNLVCGSSDADDGYGLGLDKIADKAWSADLSTQEKAVQNAQQAYDTAGPDEKEEKLQALETAKETLTTAQDAAIKKGNTAIDGYLEQIEGAISKLREVASDFGSAYSIIETRQDFTENLINVLTEGADDLTLADMNEESANMLALQTRQQLAINALSLSSQASQSVLSLF